MMEQTTNENMSLMDAKTVKYPCASCKQNSECTTVWDTAEDKPVCKRYQKWFSAKWPEIKKQMQAVGFRTEPKATRGRKKKRRIECDAEKVKEVLRAHKLTSKRVSLESGHNGYWLSNMANNGYLSQDALDALEAHGITEREVAK